MIFQYTVYDVIGAPHIFHDFDDAFSFIKSKIYTSVNKQMVRHFVENGDVFDFVYGFAHIQLHAKVI